MKMQITFTEVSIREAAFLLEFVQEHLPEIGPEPDDSKPKRKRRTKEEMELARQAGAVVASPESEDSDGEEAPVRRRKKRGADVGPEVAETNLARGRKKRGGGVDPTPAQSAGGRKKRSASASTTTSPSDDEITDEDVMKVASEGAQHLTPKFILDKLEEFGAAMVNDLDQEQRREFVDAVQAALEEAGQSE